MTTRNEDGPRVVDARGLKCPWPVLRTARAMRECGEILLLADDPVALTDVPALARTHDWSVEMHEHSDHTEYRLLKSKI